MSIVVYEALQAVGPYYCQECIALNMFEEYKKSDDNGI